MFTLPNVGTLICVHAIHDKGTGNDAEPYHVVMMYAQNPERTPTKHTLLLSKHGFRGVHTVRRHSVPAPAVNCLPRNTHMWHVSNTHGQCKDRL